VSPRAAPARVNPLPWLLALLGIGLAVGAWLWVERNFERQTREIDTGLSAEAKRNPFLAAERFLRELGFDVESTPGRQLLRELPPTRDLLLINGLETLNTERRQRLRAWLARGGRLVVEATRVLEPDAQPRADDFLAGFGAVLREEPDTGELPAEVVADIRFKDYPRPVQVGFVARYYLEDAADRAVSQVVAGDRARLLQYHVGKGLLTVTSDNVFLTNDDIGNHDHALALALLTRGGDKVWLLYDQSAPSLPALLWGAAPQAVIAAGLLLVALIWHQGRALGPRLPAPSRARRDLADHLEAAAALMWRLGRGELLMEGTRQRIERAWLRRHPRLRDLDPAGRAEWLGAQIGVDPARLHDALYRRQEHPDDFIARSRLLQRLWSAL
jgi:hypothetical protein